MRGLLLAAEKRQAHPDGAGQRPPAVRCPHPDFFEVHKREIDNSLDTNEAPEAAAPEPGRRFQLPPRLPSPALPRARGSAPFRAWNSPMTVPQPTANSVCGLAPLFVPLKYWQCLDFTSGQSHLHRARSSDTRQCQKPNVQMTSQARGTEQKEEQGSKERPARQVRPPPGCSPPYMSAYCCVFFFTPCNVTRANLETTDYFFIQQQATCGKQCPGTAGERTLPLYFF